MKIIFRISYMGFGGAEQVFISLAKQWLKEHQILFVTDKSVGASYETLQELNIPVKSLECNRTFLSVLKFKKVIQGFNPDLILSAYPDTNAACILSAKLARTKAKVVVSEHASIVEHFSSKSQFTKKKVTAIVKYLYPLADKVVAVSEGVMSDLIPLVKQPGKCTFIHNPIRFQAKNSCDISKKSATSSEKFKLLAVGRVTPQKDYTTLLKAVAELKNRSVRASLTILGGTHDKTEMAKLSCLVNELDISDRVDFAGFSNNVVSFYSQADLFVLSSAWEGFGNVIVEALAFGLPVVSTDCRSGPREILESGKYGRLVPVGDHILLSEAICSEIISPSCSRSIRLKRAEDFSENIVADRYFSLFLKL
ncbi:glycosyltransferase [Vibrio salinus]|uniref:glycosyltransferase n=1 Tax=Vibrio salinus TaxID=2899784 RepID=UPI001E44BB16|nr:glycosyltransferase [Vibrio salinus]MCE0493304.1 glycosyltransferase [Vibrio salinus]